jgi:hypothetical protein
MEEENKKALPIPSDLQELYDEAVRERKLLSVGSFPVMDVVWFTPSQALEQWRQGNFRWSRSNWALRVPSELLRDFDSQILRLQRERFKWEEAIQKERW